MIAVEGLFGRLQVFAKLAAGGARLSRLIPIHVVADRAHPPTDVLANFPSDGEALRDAFRFFASEQESDFLILANDRAIERIRLPGENKEALSQEEHRSFQFRIADEIREFFERVNDRCMIASTQFDPQELGQFRLSLASPKQAKAFASNETREVTLPGPLKFFGVLSQGWKMRAQIRGGIVSGAGEIGHETRQPSPAFKRIGQHRDHCRGCCAIEISRRRVEQGRLLPDEIFQWQNAVRARGHLE